MTRIRSVARSARSSSPRLVAARHGLGAGPLITARTPSRGDDRRRHDRRGRRQRLVRSFGDHRHDERRRAPQPTNVVGPRRPPPDVRHAARARRRPTPLHRHGHRRLDHPDHQLHLRGPHRSRRARRAQAGLQLRRPARRLRVALRAAAGRHQRPDRHLRPQPDQRRGAPGQRVVDRRPGARRREHQPGDQRQRPLRRLPVAGDQPGAGRHQRLDGRLRPRPRRRRQRHLRRGRQGRDRARQPRPERRHRPRPGAGRSAATAATRSSAATAATSRSTRRPTNLLGARRHQPSDSTCSCSTGRGA